MTKSAPIAFLSEAFERFVLRPVGAIRPVTSEGYARAGPVIAAALEALRMDDPTDMAAPARAGRRWPPIFDERIFVRDGHWLPACVPYEGTAQEDQFLYSLRFLVTNVLQCPDFTIAGYREPREHDRAHTQINSGWWDDHIKVDFKNALLWSFDRDGGNWRLLFSDIMICRPGWYAGIFETQEALPRPSPRIFYSLVVPEVVNEVPAARALIGVKNPRRGAIKKAVDLMMEHPRLKIRNVNRKTVERFYRHARTGK